MNKVLAIDIGASSGRAIIVTLNSDKLELDEIYRFKNEPVSLNDHLYWDSARLFNEIITGINECVKSGHTDIESIGVDTWGVDYGLLDKDGDLISAPYHYRDKRVSGIEKYLDDKVGLRNLYFMSGVQNIWFNTSYQLSAMKKDKPELLSLTKSFLMIPDLIAYFLTGEKANEFTVAATTQLYDIENGLFDKQILKSLDLPDNIFCRTVYPGEMIGVLHGDIAEKCGLPHGVKVIAAACHDTASAVTAVPASGDDFCFISCGTWSLMGTVIDKPIINDESYEFGFSNEGMPDKKIKFLKNIMGLWIIQECRNYWLRQGKAVSFDDLEKSASESEPFVSFIDVEDSCFINPASMPDAISEYCRRTGQSVPDTDGAVVRCAYESLAMKYRNTLEKIEKITGVKINKIHIIGGGCKDRQLCKMTADCTGRTVICGPVEATALGNGINQLIGLGAIKDIEKGREAVLNSIETFEFNPSGAIGWNSAYEKYLGIISKQ